MGNYKDAGLTDPLMRANHFTVLRWILAALVALGHIQLLFSCGYQWRMSKCQLFINYELSSDNAVMRLL